MLLLYFFITFMKLLRLLSLGLLLALRLPAAAQALDPTFTVPTGLYKPGAVYTMGPQQADGKRIVGGTFTRVNNVAVGNLVRLDAAGTLDQAFAQNVGLARNTFRLKVLANGQYLVAPFESDLVTAGGLTRAGLLRLNADGTADASFNAGTGPANGSNYHDVRDFVAQPDGKILVGGSFSSFSGRAAGSLVRLQADGSLDPGFSIGTGFDGTVEAICLQPDGKILVGGTFLNVNGQAGRSLVRLNANGSLDASFATNIHTGSYVGSLLLQPDGKLLVTGVLGVGAIPASIIRLTANGSLDTGFTAPAFTNIYASNYFDSNVLLQPDGKILFFGDFNAPGANHVVRLNPDASQDMSFASNGGPSDAPYTIGLQADGSVLIGGEFGSFNGTELNLGRLTDTGAADPTFAPKLQTAGTVKAMVRQADGQFVVGGDFTELSGQPVHRLARLSATGVPDAAYQAATSVLPGFVSTLALQADGKLLVGTTRGLRRVLPSGSLETGYNTFAAAFYITSLALQADGKLLVGGNFSGTAAGAAYSNVARLATDGSFDPSFVRASSGNLGTPAVTTALLVQPDGRLVVASIFFTASQPSTAPHVERYESTGALDAAFSSAPTFLNADGSRGYNNIINSLALQPDGKLLVGGHFGAVDGTTRPNLARLTDTGTLDFTFVPTNGLNGSVYSLALQPNGRVLVGGSFTTSGTYAYTNLVRASATGPIDPSFANTANPNGSVNSQLVQPDGSIMVAGSFTTIGGQAAIGVARITAPNVLAVAAPTTLAAHTEAWPVPAHSVLHVAADASARPQAVELRDALGRLVLTQVLTATATDVPLNLTALPAGVYLLRVQYAAGSVTRQVAVQ